MDSVRDMLMIEIVPMNFISYQKLVKMVKDVCYSMGLSCELALEIELNWHCLCMNYFKFLNFHGMNKVSKTVEAYLTKGWIITVIS